MRIGSVILLLAVILGGGWVYFFGTHYIQAIKMEDVVGSAALSWQALGETRGHQQLGEEMRRREIPSYITPEECTFYEEPGGTKVVECSWFVDVYLPLMKEGRRLRFRVAKAASPSGDLQDR
jgi:hypothetical protein